jgi:transposase
MAASPAPLPLLLPDQHRLKLERIEHDERLIVIQVSATGRSAGCPACGLHSDRVHSRYGRTLRDLPSQGLSIQIRLQTRRFYCRCDACRQYVFTERFPTLAQPHARQTDRHRGILGLMGYFLGGEAGFRLARQLGVDCSADSILRVVKTLSSTQIPVTRVLGVDDWAWRKGHRYGTVLVDLERHQPIDLLPDRESKTLVHWLKTHPGVEVISRDRAGAYADAARKGAPEALQIADRFHILCNLTQAIQRLLERFAGSLQRLKVAEPDVGDASCLERATLIEPTGAVVKPTKPQQRAVQDREARKARYDAVQAARKEGLSKSAIARQFNLTHTTVRRLLQAEEFPERAPRRHRSALDPFRDYLQKRWADGCHNASQLCRELRQKGYQGQRSRVKEYLHDWRLETRPPSVRRRKMPNLRLVAFWLSKPPEERKGEEQQWARVVTAAQPEIATAEGLVLRFRELLKNRHTSGLDAWLETTENAGIPELKSFVTGIRRDYDAVTAGIGQKWSNGQVEGQVHRLKLLKRQMYGRAGFHLLRTRVLGLQSVHTSHAHSP